MTLAQLETIGIATALASTHFNLDEAARILGMGRTTLLRKVKEHGFREGKTLGMAASTEPMGLVAIELAGIETALAGTGFNVSEAARVLGIGRTTLIRKIKAHGLRQHVVSARASTARASTEKISKRTPKAQRKRKAKQAEFGKCLRCQGVVRSLQGPGRKYSYRRRVEVEIPHDFPTDTCGGCGEIYMNDLEVSELDKRIEQRAHEGLKKKAGKRALELRA